MNTWTEMGWISEQKAALIFKRDWDWDRAEIKGHNPQGMRTMMISSDLEEKPFFLDCQEDQKQTALRIPLFPGRPHHEVLILSQR